MYCNHRDSKHPGACKNCWRSGIVLWAILVLGLSLWFSIEARKPIILFTLLGWIVGQSAGSHWNKGD